MNHFESEIRAMLTARAGDIASAPPLLSAAADDEAPDVKPPTATGGHERSIPRRSSARWLVAASVAAVLVVAGGVIGVRLWVAEGSNDVPAGPTPSTTAAPTSVPTPTPTPTITATYGVTTTSQELANTADPSAVMTSTPSVLTTDPGRVTYPPGATGDAQVTTACVAPLPDSWRVALSQPGTAYGAWSAWPLGVAADGTVLVARDFGQGKARDLVLVRPGAEPEVVYTVADPATTGIQSAALVGDELVVSVGSNPRAPKGEEPGSSPLANVTEIDLVDLATGAQRVIARNGPSPAKAGTAAMTIDTAAVIDGIVYWDVRASYVDPAGTIESYDLATGVESTAYRGPAAAFYNGLNVGAAGITVGGQLLVPAGLPTAVQDAVPADDIGTVQTDGTAYAWLAGPQEIGWWQPGAASPSYVRLPEVMQPDLYAKLLTVAGPLVVVGDSTVLDMTTAAVTSLPEGAAPPVDIGRGVVYTASRVGTGHFDDDGYWVDPSQRANLIELSSLPALACG